MTGSETEPYEALASLIERELELVGGRRFDELRALKATRRALELTFPPAPPPSARPVIERCQLLQKRVEIELLRVREALLIELEQVRHAQRAADGYAPAMQRRPRVHLSA